MARPRVGGSVRPSVRDGRLRPRLGRRPRAPVPPPTPSPAPSPADERARVDGLVAKFREGARENRARSHWIGTQLLELKRARAQRFYGTRTFEAFVSTIAKIPYRTARRYMTVAQHFEREVVVGLGVSKCEQLIRLHGELGRRHGRNPRELLQRNPRLGRNGKTLRRMQAKEIDELIRGMRLRAARRAIPEPTRTEKSVLTRFRAELDTLGLGGQTRFDTRAKIFEVRIPLAELRSRYR